MVDELELLALIKKVQNEARAVVKQPGPPGLDGLDGASGKDGRDGKDGKPGKDGKEGATGPAGAPGVDGEDGEDGRGIESVSTAADGDLVFHMTDGTEEVVEFPEQLMVSSHSHTTIRTGGQGGDGGNGGPADYTWIDYAANFLSPPVFLETINAGDVYEYTYSSGTLYRLVGGSGDSFYSTFNTPTLSGLVVSRDLNF